MTLYVSLTGNKSKPYWNHYVFHWVENTVGEEENAAYQYFLIFQKCFQNSLKVVIVCY